MYTSRFNPFQTLCMGQESLYSTYVRWTGESDKYKGNTTGLKTGMVYRVTNANIQSSYTLLELQEITTGLCLKSQYNSCYFKSLPGYIGYATELPKIGECFEMVKIDVSAHSTIGWSTSAVQGFEQVSENVWNVITLNSVYTVFIS